PVEIASCSTIKRTDPLEPEETGDGGLQLPGKDQVIFRPSEKITISVIHFQFHLRTPTVSSIMASIDEDVEKSSLADQEDKIKLLKKNDLLDMLVPRMLSVWNKGLNRWLCRSELSSASRDYKDSFLFGNKWMGIDERHADRKMS
ncbi:hypothetical protein Tco_1421916, partial [Tanacetum coccineum]